MRLRLCFIVLLALVLSVTPAFASESATATLTSAHKVVVNGHAMPSAMLHENRLYVPAESFAKAIGGELTKDENGVYWINTGKGLPTVAALTEMNPALKGYEALSPFVPGMGVHIGVAGPGLVLAVSDEGTVNAFEILVPAEQGWQPWFDQREGEPMEMPYGKVYTQHVYVTSPAGIMPAGGGVPVIIDGRYLSSGFTLKSFVNGDMLYIPLRSAVDLLGGSVVWNQTTFTATATVESKGISFEWLKKLNPALEKYEPISPFVPNMGFHYGVHGPHVTVLVDSAGMVNGVELVVPAAGGWFPWFDQPEGEPMMLEGMATYTQHIYFVDPTTIK